VSPAPAPRPARSAGKRGAATFRSAMCFGFVIPLRAVNEATVPRLGRAGDARPTSRIKGDFAVCSYRTTRRIVILAGLLTCGCPTAEADSVAPGVLIDWDAKTEIGDATPLIWECQTGGTARTVRAGPAGRRRRRTAGLPRPPPKEVGGLTSRGSVGGRHTAFGSRPAGSVPIEQVVAEAAEEDIEAVAIVELVVAGVTVCVSAVPGSV